VSAPPANAAVLVAGASSQVGVFLLPRLLDAGYRVRALSRRASGTVNIGDRLSWSHPDRERGGAREETSGLPRFLVSAGPPVLALELLERNPQIEKAVVFSTTSVLTKHASDDEAERELMARILREESQLRAQCRRSGTPLVLIRPTLVYGCGLDRNLSRLVRFGDRTGFIPVSSAAAGLRQPVHAADLADLATAALGADTGGILEGPACGAEQLSYRAMVHRAAACCRRRVRCPEWPPRLLAAAAGLAGRLLGSSGINAQMVYRQAEDLVFDDHVFRSRLGYRPRPFRPTRADFSIPQELLRYRLPG
jgi:nucleoside-diphosphate-sugar epimerase